MSEIDEIHQMLLEGKRDDAKNGGHVLLNAMTCPCDKSSERLCVVCDWGLAVCANCGAGESELERKCTKPITR